LHDKRKPTIHNAKKQQKYFLLVHFDPKIITREKEKPNALEIARRNYFFSRYGLNLKKKYFFKYNIKVLGFFKGFFSIRVS